MGVEWSASFRESTNKKGELVRESTLIKLILIGHYIHMALKLFEDAFHSGMGEKRM